MNCCPGQHREKSIGLQTDLVAEDSLLQVFEKREDTFVVSTMISKLLQFWLPVQRPPSILNILELAGRISEPISAEEITAYRSNSLRRLCSVTSPGGVSKTAPSASTDERRISILFLTAMDSYGWVSRRIILSREVQTNFMISISGGNGFQDGAERTESMYSLLCDANGGGSCLERRVLAFPLRDW